jgi:cytochrome c oxidase subunit 3
MISKTVTKPEMPENTQIANPIKFLVWLFIVASVMLFASFTSAYIVRRGEGNWLTYDLPAIFGINVGIAILSSLTMIWAYRSAKKDELEQLKLGLGASWLLGLAFAIGQWFGWTQLVNNNIHFVGNPSESFFYVISGMHLLHILAALVWLGLLIIKAFRFQVHKKNMLSIQLCATYWHFVGILWVYLFIFLQINR